MMRLRSAILLVAFCLLASAATAHAECAWVLWRNIETPKMSLGGVWGIHEAYDSRKECDEERATIFAKLETMVAPDDRRFEKKGRQFLVIDKATSRTIRAELLQCLPSGTDPRPRSKE